MIKYGNIEELTPEEVQAYYKDLFYRLFDIILSLDYEKNSKKILEMLCINYMTFIKRRCRK